MKACTNHTAHRAPSTRSGTRHLIAAALLFLPSIASAHVPLHGVGTVSEVIFHSDRVLVTFDLSYDGFWAHGEMIKIDANENSAVEKDEADKYLQQQWQEKIAPKIRALINGQDAKIKRLRARHENLVGPIYGVPFSLYYDLEIPLPTGKVAPGEWSEFEFHDIVVKGETKGQPQFFIPYVGHGGNEGLRCRIDLPPRPVPALEPKFWVVADSRLIARFLFELAGSKGETTPPQSSGEAKVGPTPSTKPTPPQPSPLSVADPDEQRSTTDTPAIHKDSDYSRNLQKAVHRYHELSWGEMLSLFFLAILWGAGHAMTPGHGKSMVAAYLIGSRGRVSDAVILGAVTTITHTGSVFLFGAGVYLVVNATTQYSTGHLQNLVIVGTQLFSGLLLTVMGTILFFRRVSGVEPGHSHHHAHSEPHNHRHSGDHQHHEHTHSHGHSHSHEHAARQVESETTTSGKSEVSSRGLMDGGKPRLWDLIALGFSGGLVPCPAGLTVIIIGLQYVEYLAFTLLLLVFFSIGLGGVLIAIGVLLITGKALAESRGSVDGRFLQDIRFLQRVLPASALAAMNQFGLRALKVVPPLSCLFIAGLGVFFLVKTYLDGKTEIVTMLRMLADTIDPGP